MWKKGQTGEDLALAFLKKQGFVLRERNYRAKHKEIDLIMEEKDILVFVEVKARSGGSMVSGREAVDLRKQKNLIQAAQYYLLEQGGTLPYCRFDVCEVDLDTKKVEHLRDAFRI